MRLVLRIDWDIFPIILKLSITISNKITIFRKRISKKINLQLNMLGFITLVAFGTIYRISKWNFRITLRFMIRFSVRNVIFVRNLVDLWFNVDSEDRKLQEINNVRKFSMLSVADRWGFIWPMRRMKFLTALCTAVFIFSILLIKLLRIWTDNLSRRFSISIRQWIIFTRIKGKFSRNCY